jgi:hypothetical protein
MTDDVLDINHQVIEVGDLVLDSKGKVWRIEETEQSFRAIKVLRAVEQRPRRGGWGDGITLVILASHVAVVTNPPRGGAERKALYEEIYEASPEHVLLRERIRGMQRVGMNAVRLVRERA